MFIIYDIIFILFSLLYLPKMILKGKWRWAFLSRFGFFSKDTKIKLRKKENIWIHAVSVGEVLVIVPLIRQLQDHFPQCQVVCTTVTKTGYDLAKSQLFSSNVIVLYAPFDLSFSVGRYIKAIHPKIYLSSETEIWPNTYTMLYKKNIPIIQINGRISDKAYEGYKKIGFLTRKILKCVTMFCMQSEEDKQRILSFGVDSFKICRVGNLKFDMVIESQTVSLAQLGLEAHNKILLAGSTHRQEEEIILNIYKRLLTQENNLRLILAPRHIERVTEVKNIIKKYGFETVLYSQIKNNKGNKVILVDTIGDLRNLYSVATIVFIGKSFVVGGGQNMIEPVYFGKPTFVGPRTENFKDVMKIFLKERAVIQVKSPEDLFLEMKNVLEDFSYQQEISRAAKKIIASSSGATQKTFDIVAQYLKDVL
ncbi:MAG TPA: 3-deoxy-D-manno-octulosonic acid transferase [Candidatus Omnitrophota bacterium]|nr:3-deoxy-D-manno-octulosonic acid transferase [Candidatus Omnitrophota bacterium]